MNLEGMSNCTKCHEIGEEPTNSKCLDCHKELNTMIKEGHGFNVSSDVKSKDCYVCHSEHNGRDFDMIHFVNQDKFNHSKTGYELIGKHKKAECKDCHQEKNIVVKKFKKSKNTFMGLGRECANCHEDFHQGTLKGDCQSCHNTESFRPAPKFDHNKAKFKLTGKHKTVDCNKCHKLSKLNGKDFQQFTGLKFGKCISCHKDEHKGKFGKNC